MFPIFQQLPFPTLEILAADCDADVSSLLSTLLSDPSSCPSFKTLVFPNCDITENFMEELTQFASNRRNTTSAWLRSVVISDSRGMFPSVASIHELGINVPDVKVGTIVLPKSLT